MGAFLDKPNTEKRSASGSFKDLRYGLSSMQGWRREMEDAHCAVTQLPGLKDWSFFAVFDGHAGSRVSAVCSKDLVSEITKQTPSQDTGEQVAAENIKLAIKKGFLALDDRMRELPEVVSGEDKSGSTAVCVMISPTHVFFANCGDSRGLLCRKGKVKFATLDHKPMNSDEKKRIQSAGGIVMTQRVNGSLAVSRALGDFDYKNVEGKGQCEQLVSPEPEIEEIARKPDDEFVILACDGVYDVMSNDDLCAFVRNRMQISDDLEKICSQVVDTCLYKGSRDNMSIVIITFKDAPKVSQEAVAKERELDERIETNIKEIIAKSEDTLTEGSWISFVYQKLSEKKLKNLPPGGGLEAKKQLIEDTVNRLKPPANASSR